MSRRTFLLSLVILLIAISAVFAALLTTETGLRFALARVESALPGVRVDSVEGRLIGPIRLSGIHYEGDGFQGAVDSIDIRWRPTRLLSGTLSIDRLTVTGLRHVSTSAESDAAGAGISLPRSVELPVDVELAEAHFERLVFGSPADAELFLIDSLSFGGGWDQHGITLSDISANSQVLDVSGQIALVPRGKYPLESELRYEFRPPGYAPVVGVVEAGGNLEQLRLTQIAGSPYGLRLVADVTELLSDAHVEGKVDLDQADLKRVSADWPAASLSVSGEFSGSPNALALSLDAEFFEADAGALTASFAGSYTPSRVGIDTLQITLAERPGRLTASGELVLEGVQPRVDLRADWQELQWPLTGTPSFSSSEGRLEVRGTLDDYAIHAEGGIQGPARTQGRFLVRGAGDRKSLSLADIDLAVLDGQVNASLGLGWHEAVELEVSARGRDLNPAEVLSDWPGAIEFTFEGEGSLADGVLAAEVRELSVRGRLRGRELGLDASGGYDAESLELSLFRLRAGATELSGDGRLGAQSEFDWALHSPDLGGLLPELAGRLQGSGRIRGALEAPQIVTELEGAELRYGGYALGSLRLEAEVDAAAIAPSRIDLFVEDGRLDDLSLERLVLQVQGRERSHEFSLNAQTSIGTAALAGSGSMEDEVWAFELARADLGSWFLRSPASGRVALAESQLSKSCWSSGRSNVCMDGEIGSAGMQAGFELDDLPMDYLTPAMPADVELHGSISGAGDIEWQAGRLTGVVGLETTESRFTVREEPALLLAPGKMSLSASPDGGAELVVDLPLAAGGGLRVAGNLSSGSLPFSQRAVNGRLDIDVGELDFIADLVPPIDTMDGEFTGHVKVSGTLGTPVLKGRVALSEGSAGLLGPEIILEDLNVVLAGGDSGEVAVSARASSAGGTLRVEGNARVVPGESVARLSVSGKDFQILNTPEATVLASPDLELDVTPRTVNVRGEVHVPVADIKVNTVSESAIPPSADQIIVLPESETARDKGPELSAQVTVVLGDQVRFEGLGLEASLAGRVTATEKPGEPTTASGEIRVVEGSYQAYGQSLNIETGRLIFSGGPVDRPGVDVRAVRQPTKDITVGVSVRGTLRRPAISLFSEPSMKQSEQLSYLVLGRSLEDSSGAESSALSRAALALGMRGGSFLTDRIGGKVGLDEFSIGSEPGGPADEAALTVGKYLSPKLYVAYGIGLIKPVSTLKLQYTLSSKWKLVTESSATESGGDIIYTFDR